MTEAKEEPVIKDSGHRRSFGTGAVRDMAAGKGRNDLLHPVVMQKIMASGGASAFLYRNKPNEQIMLRFKDSLWQWYAMEDGEVHLHRCFMFCCYLLLKLEDREKMTELQIFVNGTMALAKHYEKGAIKYGENNWSKGIPSFSFYDSAHRHMDKIILGLTDEPHVEAAMFNLVGLIYNTLYRKELEFKPYAGGLRRDTPEEEAEKVAKALPTQGVSIDLARYIGETMPGFQKGSVYPVVDVGLGPRACGDNLKRENIRTGDWETVEGMPIPKV